jgi:lipooligosaccharide transport system permease protein
MLGQVGAETWVHVGYLASLGVIGTVWTAMRIERLLLR